MERNSEQEILDEIRRGMDSAEALFSNKGQGLQERVAVSGLLRVFGIEFHEEEIIKRGPEPIDVWFREARFQVTEVLDHGRPRNWEIKQRAIRTRDARSLKELVEPGIISSRTIGVDELAALVSQRAREKADRYAGKLGDIDLLIYVNLRQRHMDPSASIVHDMTVESIGWRSVSVVMERFGAVLWAADNAPSFLVERKGQAIHSQKLDSVFLELTGE
jgi:hypothetical protein